jgi:hypothetical protein
MRSLLAGVGLLLLGFGAGWAQTKPEEQERAIAAIVKAGGTTHCDAKRPGSPVVAVELTGCDVTTAGLKHLAALTELQSLDL